MVNDSNSNEVKTAQLLDVVGMPLRGRHLIEASAGTGKTFNITRLYLRLLLEKALTVKDILVMTFTKAATEEIKGRIAKTLREATQIWQKAIDNNNQIDPNCDAVYQHLFNNNDALESLARLKAAQLELDDASVFTIHGFCQHVIAQLAFDSGFAMSLNLAKDTSDLYLQAAEDYIRQLSEQEEDFLLLAQAGWHTPDRLLGEFNASIKSTLAPTLLDEQAIEKAFFQTLNNSPSTEIAQFSRFLADVESNESLLVAQLIKTPAHKKTRPQELEALKAWLNTGAESQQYSSAPDEALAFLDARRYARNTSGVKEILTPIKNFAKDIQAAIDAKSESIEKIPLLQRVSDAISFIKLRVAKQKKHQGIIDFDDLIRLLADEVVKPGNALSSALRNRFPVALIDEFQDTDAKQYAILDAVYPKGADSDNALLMIGDPKQAIYRFRGGDIFTYLKAGRQADYRWVMNTNWRSVEGMVKAYNRLFYGAPINSGNPVDVFGFGITYSPVEFTSKAAAAKTPLYDPHDNRNAMNYITMHMDDKQDANTMRRNMASWIAQEIYRLLNDAHFTQQTVSEQSDKNTNAGSNTSNIPVKPADIAILVKDRTEANIVKYVLQQNGLACVYLSDRSNLFAAPEAKDILRLLNGIWHATDSRKVAASLASPLWGYSPETLIELLYHENDSLWDSAFDKVLTLKEMWLQKGCMSVILHLMQSSYHPHGNDIERALTNYQHLAEVLEKASTTHQRPEQLLDWLNKQIEQPESDEELTLRLESDSQLIRLITQHGSKGLEYPIVFIPFGTSYKDAARNGKSMSHIFTYFDEEKQDLQLQLGQSQQAIDRVRAEGAAEDMRLAYVAITRAAHRCYMGIIPLDGNEKSAMANAFGLNEIHSIDGQQDVENNPWCNILSRIASEQDAFTCHIDGEFAKAQNKQLVNNEKMPELSVSQFTGTASETWRLYSFSALSRLTTHTPSHLSVSAAVSSTPLNGIPIIQTVRDEELFSDDETLILKESQYQRNADNVFTASATKDSLRFTLPKGASAGNLLHDILEHTDFSKPEWEEVGSELVIRFGLEEPKVPALYAWLNEVLNTPLRLKSGLCMCDLHQNQTLREAEFYFPMNDSQWSLLREILVEHRKNVASRLSANALPVPNLLTSELEGMMHGFIDLIFEHEGKYYVADYKSTWLGDTVGHYTPSVLFENNQHHLYDLQYLIYSVALHRYLQNTLPDYTPEQYFGGVYYLYLRGMHPDNKNEEGVFYTSISLSVLRRLDAVFSGNVTNTSSPEQQQFSFDDE
ncbi:MAG: exodeoxyribonuclease V subunit beta [Alteromonas sp. Nap_26]|nr:MAG: exodeoxyribonuclease V subunit beta [Alteromonas sp. Nap_26]